MACKDVQGHPKKEDMSSKTRTSGLILHIYIIFIYSSLIHNLPGANNSDEFSLARFWS